MALYIPVTIVILLTMAIYVPGGERLWKAEDCFIQALIPKPIECENATYVIRRWDDITSFDNSKRFYLYRKAPLVEHLICIRRAADVEYEECYAKRILEVNESKEILQVEVDVYADYNFTRKEIQEWKINGEKIK